MGGRKEPYLKSLLFIALEWKRENFAIMLVNVGANPNQQDKEKGALPIHLAIILGLPEIAKKLVEKGANINSLHEGVSPLTIASVYGNLELVRYLCSIPNIDLCLPFSESNQDMNIFYASPLGQLIKMGKRIFIFAELIKQIKAKYQNSSFSFYKIIIEMAFFMAIQSPDCGAEMLAIIEAERLTQNRDSLEIKLRFAMSQIANDDEASLRKLLFEGLAPNSYVEYESNKYLLKAPLIYAAAANNSAKVVKLLLSHKADSNLLASDGLDAIAIAVSKANIETIKILIPFCDINKVYRLKNDSYTLISLILGFAAKSEDVKLIENVLNVLLEADADAGQVIDNVPQDLLSLTGYIYEKHVLEKMQLGAKLIEIFCSFIRRAKVLHDKQWKFLPINVAIASNIFEIVSAFFEHPDSDKFFSN